MQACISNIKFIAFWGLHEDWTSYKLRDCVLCLLHTAALHYHCSGSPLDLIPLSIFPPVSTKAMRRTKRRRNRKEEWRLSQNWRKATDLTQDFNEWVSPKLAAWMQQQIPRTQVCFSSNELFPTSSRPLFELISYGLQQDSPGHEAIKKSSFTESVYYVWWYAHFDNVLNPAKPRTW